jgi:hypothetical protein
MLNFINTFRADEDGAVTVDWVVLTAALVVLGFAVLNAVSTATTNATADITGDLGTIDGSAADAAF